MRRIRLVASGSRRAPRDLVLAEGLRVLEEADEKKTRSPFEREVMKHLEDHGYRVTPHWRVGKYWIDLVVEGDGFEKVQKKLEVVGTEARGKEEKEKR